MAKFRIVRRQNGEFQVEENWSNTDSAPMWELSGNYINYESQERAEEWIAMNNFRKKKEVVGEYEENYGIE